MFIFRVFSILTSLYLLLFIVDVNTFQFLSKNISNQLTSELFEEEEAEEKSKIDSEEYDFYTESIAKNSSIPPKLSDNKILHSDKSWTSLDYFQCFSPPPES